MFIEFEALSKNDHRYLTIIYRLSIVVVRAKFNGQISFDGHMLVIAAL